MQLFNDYVLIAKDFSIDQNDNMVSLFKLVDSFTFTFKEDEFKQAFKASPGEKNVLLPVTYIVATSWSSSEKVNKDLTYTITASFISPDGENLTSATQEVKLPKGSDRMRINFGVQGLPVKNSGKYKYMLEVKDAQGHSVQKGECFMNVVLDINKEEKE